MDEKQVRQIVKEIINTNNKQQAFITYIFLGLMVGGLYIYKRI